MDSVNLNIDVLHLILDRSDQNTVSQIMKTCHFLNREGAKYLLSRGPAITNEAQAASFVQFALPTRQSADVAHRLYWIESLHIPILNEEESRIVAQVLTPFFTLAAPRAPNFSVLEIDFAERFFVAAPEICAPIASLTTLDFLSVSEAGAQTVVMLRALQSPLTKVEVHFDPEIGPWAQEDQDPLTFLHRSQDTLRCISLMCTVSSPAAGCYRNVRMLTLNFIDPPTTRHFVHAFPNLQCLRATESRFRFGFDPDEAGQSQRDLNVTEQARDGSWGGLTSYKGSIFMLYVLALKCSVTHVYVHDDDLEGIMEPRQIQAVLADSRPLHLTIRIRGVEDFLMQAHEFIELSRSREFQVLPSLRLQLTIRRGNWDADLEGIVNLVYDAIAPSPIPSVTLVIDITTATTKPRFTQHRPRPPNEPPTPSPVKLYMDSLDQDAVADRLFTGNPSRCAVKVVFIHDWEKQAVVNRGDPRSIIELDFDRFF